MALQDLTPQLRTRLSRMERAVGWFVILATALLAFGLGYYIYQRAQSKGWFIKKIYYQTSISSGAGLKEGDPVKLMGFDVGEITRIQPNGPYDYYNITVEFRIKAPNFGYIWSDSTVKVAAGDFLGHRYLEINKGRDGVPTIDETNKTPVGILKLDYLNLRIQALTAEMKKQTNYATDPAKLRTDLFARLNAEAKANKSLFYTNLTANSLYWLEPEESPALTERLEKLVAQVEAALPNILSLTNQLATVLANSANMTSNLNTVAVSARPAVSNLNFITAQLKGPGTLGDWLLHTNTTAKLDSVMSGADVLVANANTNLANLNLAIINLANITSNLNAQVQSNSNILSGISKTVEDVDTFVQGLKHHWLLRSAFKTKKTNAPPKK